MLIRRSTISSSNLSHDFSDRTELDDYNSVEISTCFPHKVIYLKTHVLLWEAKRIIVIILIQTQFDLLERKNVICNPGS